MDKSIRDKYTAVIGLEVHAQLLTKSKIYNTDSTEYGSLPNTNVSVITLAHPGTLPRLNKRVVEYAIKMGLACHSAITRFNIFDRKNYFYPDLPKGYQITQDRTPICVGGFITIDSKEGPRNISPSSEFTSRKMPVNPCTWLLKQIRSLISTGPEFP